MSSAKGIIHINVGLSRQQLGKPVVIVRFLRVKPKVLKQQDVSGLHFGHEPLHLRTDAVGREAHLLAQQSPQAFGHGSEAELGNHLSPRSSEVRAENDFCALIDGVIDRGQGGPDPRVIQNIQILIQGNIKIGPDKDALSLDGNILDGQFVHVHGGSFQEPDTCLFEMNLMRSRTRQE